MSLSESRSRRLARLRLWVEFGIFYLAAPAGAAVFLPANLLFPMLFSVTAVGLVLLHATPGFAWPELTTNVRRVGWGYVAFLTLVTAGIAYVVARLRAPEALLYLVEHNPSLMLMIALLYPPLSALPQELVFRPLFFRRYGALLPDGAALQVLLNAAVFSFAHLMYWSWLVAMMTFCGGVFFAWSYRVRDNFAEAVLLHAAAGIVVFAMGLGVFFYSGNVERPF